MTDQLVYQQGVSTQGGAGIGCSIAAANLDGSNQHELLTSFSTGVSPTDGPCSPVLSPNGQEVAFTDEGGCGIWVMNINGTDVHALVDGSSDPACGEDSNSMYEPHWSPDGKTIVFIRNDAPSTSIDIWAVNADGSDLRSIITWPSQQDHPIYSAAGSTIAFESYATPTGTILKTPYVYTYNLNTYAVSKLAAGVPDSYSPNGALIAYTVSNTKTDSSNIYTMTATGGSQKQITTTWRDPLGLVRLV